MRGAPTHCPNAACEHHTGTPGRFYGRWGHFTTKHNRQPVPRYRCKACGRLFSAAHTKTRLRQHRPELNAQLFKLLVSGVNARRAAQVLGCTRGTVDRKIRHLAKLAQQHHAVMLAGMKTSHVMMDELITFLHARPRRVSVAMVVRPNTGQVLGFAVCRIPGIEAAQEKYQWFNDDRPKKVPALLKILAPVLKAEATLTSDADPSYPKWIRRPTSGIHCSPST
jgi:transposase-like protein